MKKIHYTLLILTGLVMVACETTSRYPDVSPDGLTRIDSKRADAIYVRPEADLSRYTKVQILEPQISFRKYWQQDINSQRGLDGISDQDMEEMITTGKRLLTEEFTEALQDGGYEVVSESGPDVLVVKPAIVDLDVFAPDPNNRSGIWTEVYSRGAGRATLWLELYDSVTFQLLVRAYDTKSDENDRINWKFPRSQARNINDARFAFNNWARMLVKGLDAAKANGA